MPAKIHHVTSWEEYEAAIGDTATRVKKVVAYFYGNENLDDPERKSWCPDCVLCEPTIKEALYTVADGTEILRVAVGDRTFWKNSDNVYRNKVGVRSIPTLIKFEDGKEIARLEEMECAAPETVNKFLQQ